MKPGLSSRMVFVVSVASVWLAGGSALAAPPPQPASEDAADVPLVDAPSGADAGSLSATNATLGLGDTEAEDWSVDATAPPPTLHVWNAGQFAAAVARLRSSGGTIQLHSARYGSLVIGPRGRAKLTVRAARGASVERLELLRTQSVALVGLRLRPRSGDAQLRLEYSRRIGIIGAHVSAAGTRLKAEVKTMDSVGVTISRSTFTECGERAVCILTGRSSKLRIVQNRFAGCHGCDFVRGRFGRDLVIRRNHFDRALLGPCGRAFSCNHQDLVELHSGRGLVVEQNRFGVYALPGGGQLALFGPVDDVLIRNNLFLRTDPRAPGVVAHVGINLGGWVGLPKRVVIANNTILSGRLVPWRGHAASVRLKDAYRLIRRENRPVLANNVLAVVVTPRDICPSVRLSVRNVVRRGERCSADDAEGDPRLDARGRPTAESELLIDQADARWAPPFDFRGSGRAGPPDIGAFEFVPR